jgi:DNA-binding transcriptional regulator YiaG
VRIQVRVSADVYQQVQTVAQEEGKTCGRVAAEAIEFYLNFRAEVGGRAPVERCIAAAVLTKRGNLILTFSEGLSLRMRPGEVSEWFGDVADCQIVEKGHVLKLIRSDGTAHGFGADFLADLSNPSVRAKSDEESAQRKMAVSRQIRAARRRMSVSAKRLAQASGVTLETLKAVERCDIEVDRKTLEALADALSVPVDELDVEELP